MLRYKVDILKELKEKDYTSYRLRKDKLIGESQIQKIRKERAMVQNLKNEISQKIWLLFSLSD